MRRPTPFRSLNHARLWSALGLLPGQAGASGGSGEMLTALTMGGVLSTPPIAAPFVPASDAQVLADLPAGAHHAGISARHLAQGRLEVAVPLAQFYIGQARASGDLRFLGYAEAVLTPWVAQAAAGSRRVGPLGNRSTKPPRICCCPADPRPLARGPPG